MLQNKIYQNYSKEILKIFLTILVGLTLIAWTVRAVNFLDLIVESGYSLSTYFLYSTLNVLGILVKFIPLSFLLALTLFILRQIQENELIILWTTGVKKIELVNLFLFVSTFITIFYLIFSTLITPFSLNKSRQLLNNSSETSLMPTVKIEEFNDSFSGLTIFVNDKFKNEIKNIFLQDDQNRFRNISSDNLDGAENTIIANKGILEKEKLILFDGSIITSNKKNSKNNIIIFEQLDLSMNNLENRTIKQPKIQETSTIKLVKCFNSQLTNDRNCENFKKEVLPVLNRRIILPFYIPLITILCSFLLIKNKKNIFLGNISIFFYNFLLLVYAEIIIRYTGLNNLMNFIFIISPLSLSLFLYFFLKNKFLKESVVK